MPEAVLVGNSPETVILVGGSCAILVASRTVIVLGVFLNSDDCQMNLSVSP